MNTRSRFWCAFLGAVLIAPAVGRASTTEEMIQDLTGNDDLARARARQLLPRENVEVVPRLLPLLAHENESVWRAAFNVLADFANETSVPGREADRAAVTAGLMTLVAADRPERIKILGLGLLPLVVPKGYDVGPIAALLDDPNLQEKARAALQEMRTPEGCAAMRAYLPKAEPKFACALLDSLSVLHDAAGVETTRDLTSHQDARVRAAAARALAWTGDPGNLDIAKGVLQSADDATRGEATDALLRLTEAIAENGGNWRIAVDTWLDLLKTGQSVVQDAALAGLARYGDGTCVKPILAAIQNVDVRTRHVGLNALEGMQGRDVARELVAAYTEAPTEFRPALVRALGAKKDALALPVLVEAAKSKEPALRLEALRAFGRAGLAEGVAVLTEAARSENPTEQAAARDGLLDLGDALHHSAKNEQAGGAYAAALAVSKDADARRRALLGVAACPSPAAFEGVMAAAEDAALAGPAVPALAAIGQALTKAKNKDQALAAFDRLRRLDPPMSVKQSMVKCLRELGVQTDMAEMLGFVKDWWLLGPFELGENNQGWNTDYVAEPRVNLVGAYMSGKRRLNWKRHLTTDESGKVDLRRTVSDQDDAIAYAYTQIIVEKETDAVLKLGVDDSEKLWVNGQKLFDQFVARGLQVDADRIPVKLKAGTNTILLKIWQNKMGWEFCLRVTTPEDRPVPFTQKPQ